MESEGEGCGKRREMVRKRKWTHARAELKRRDEARAEDGDELIEERDSGRARLPVDGACERERARYCSSRGDAQRRGGVYQPLAVAHIRPNTVASHWRA